MCNLVFGLVTEWKAGFVKVQLPTFDNIVTDWLHIIKLRAMNDDINWPLEVNEEVACVVDRYCRTGVCLGAISNDKDVPEDGAAAGKMRMYFEDATFIEYDKSAHKLTVQMSADGAEADIVVSDNTSVKLKDKELDAVISADTSITAKDKEIDIVASSTTSAVIKDGEIDATVNSTVLQLTDGTIDMKDGAGGEMQVTGGLFTIKNSGKDLKTILTNILTHIEALTVPTSTGPSGPPINTPNFVSDVADVAALLG